VPEQTAHGELSPSTMFRTRASMLGDSIMISIRTSKVSFIPAVEESFIPNLIDTPKGDPKKVRSRINLIRAVFDEAQNEIDAIDGELKILEEKKIELLRRKQAHVDMLEIAKNHF
jgi:hypothetical protein